MSDRAMAHAPGTGLLLNTAVALIGIFLIAPSAVVVVLSFSSGMLLTFPPPGLGLTWYAEFFGNRKWTDSLWASLQIAALATPLATFLALLAAFGLARGRPPFAGAVMGVLLSPLVVPVVITGIGTYMAFQRLHIGSFPGLVLAHTVLALPYALVAILAGLREIDPELERAAHSLGARPVRAFVRVTLPLLLPNIATGAVFAFVASWDEVVVALFLATPTMRTLPVTMWEEATHSMDPTVAAASSMLTAITSVALVVILLLRRSRGRAATRKEAN